MALYKLLVINWSIFTLSIQLILCASLYPNADPNSRAEIFCNLEPERFIPDSGVESSLLLDLNPGRIPNSCRRIFRAPESHGFFIHLQKTNNSIESSSSNSGNDTTITKKLQNSFPKRANTTSFCPINVFSLEDDQLPPWRFDPCQLELSDAIDEPVRILQGKVKIVWIHGGHSPNYRLSITVLGKGEPCRDKKKHACLKFGEEPLLCISQDLVCDGIRQCPTGGENYSDEDDEMCENVRERQNKKYVQKPTIWQHLTLGIFQNIFGPMDTNSALPSSNPMSELDSEKQSQLANFPKMMKSDIENRSTMSGSSNSNSNSNYNTNNNNINNNNHKVTTTKMVNNNNNKKANRGIARYGSWGYMMLGMLMCSILLLLCGIWECIRRVQKHDVTDVFNINDTREPTAQPEDNSMNDNYQLPPYDPPPAYSSLFPLQKDFNTTVNSPNSAPSSIFISSVSNSNGGSSPISVFTSTNVTLPHRNSFMNTISRISSSISFARNISSNNITNLNHMYRTRQFSENGTQNTMSHRNHTQSESQANVMPISMNGSNSVANMASNSSVLRIANSNATIDTMHNAQSSTSICSTSNNINNDNNCTDENDDNCGIVINTRRTTNLNEHSDA